MKFDQIVLTGASSITLFDHKDPLSTPYVTRTVDGLGPTETDVSLAQTTQGAGIYIGRRPQLREVTFTLDLNPNYTIGETPESLRERLYLMRPDEADGSLRLRLLLGGVEKAYTPVYIKRMESPAFAKDTVMQLVLASPREHFYQPTLDVREQLTFVRNQPILVNEGSAPTGFSTLIQFTGPRAQFILHRPSPKSYLGVIFPFLAGDSLVIDTNRGERAIYVARGGAQISLLGNLTAESSWVELYPGENQFYVIDNGDTTHPYTWLYYRYQPKFLGV